ncbi:MAG: [FeFe] hydrogenase H-cluster radical SAM maturase HydE, partial [Bacteroidales bacterium]|nr:[FeFe] hydrogenase H-cluster radical SAM maturase HydE [Bacteroidales bacterium]
MAFIEELLAKESYTKSELVELLQVTGDGRAKLFSKAAGIKEKYLGNKVYLRGLVEMSNVCRKNCLYCGIRSGNQKVNRYNLTDDEIVDAAIFAWKNKYGSIALQAGEISTREFATRVEGLLGKINAATYGELGITLSLGEQNEDTY